MRRIAVVLLALLVSVVSMSFIFLLLRNKTLDVQDNSPLIRQTANGLVEGVEQTTTLGQTYYAFKGIPFAAPPITGIDPYTGEKVDRRFKAPEPLRHIWSGALKVEDLKILCLTTESLPESYHNLDYSEDCLFLNIFVPAGGAEKKTVLVYIHGGGMDGGVTTDVLLGPDFLLSQDNVVVHLEYRVQMFGFLNLGFGEYTGNMALKDQQLGMKWVYENIENFSGQKDEIMIFGASNGATFVHAHMLNSESRKYFKRAFASSGCLNAFHLPNDNHVKALHECLEITATGNELVEYMKTVNSSTLSNCNYLPWVLFIESPNAPGAFISETPEEIYKSGKAPMMDAMFSIVSEEAVQFFSELLKFTEPLIADDRIESNRTLPFEGFAEFADLGKFKEALDKLRKVYFPDPTNVEAIKRGNLDYYSDLIVRDNVLKTVAYQADANNNSSDKSQHKNTYLLRMSTHTNLNTMKTKHNKNYTGMAHSDDICYIFYCHFLDDFQNVTEVHVQERDEVFDMVIQRVKMITNFARFGDPSIDGDTRFKSCKSSNEIYCNEISNDPKIRVTMDIKKELHYDTWREVEDIYKKWMHM